MNLKYIYINMPSQHKAIIKSCLAVTSIQILFNDAKVECESQLTHIDLDLLPEPFKLRFLELKKSVEAYDEILTLINSIKQGDI